jgi:hypothetical protein
MNLTDVLGVKCDNLRKGMFSDERVVSLLGRDYFVNNSNLIIRDDYAYVRLGAGKAIWESGEGYEVVLSLDDNAQKLFVRESDLVFV